MSSQYYSATAYVGTPHRNAVEVTIPLVGPQGPAGEAGAGAVESVNGQTGVVVLDAADVGAASTSHTHAAADITSGTLNIARIPTGTGSTQVALGNHTHTLSAITDAGTAAAQDANQDLGTSDQVTFQGVTVNGPPVNEFYPGEGVVNCGKLNLDAYAVDLGGGVTGDGFPSIVFGAINGGITLKGPEGDITTSKVINIPNASGTLGLSEPSDSTFRIVGSSDATKKVAFEVDGLSAVTTRTLTVPDASGTLALTSLVGASAELVIACSDETSNLTTGTAKVTFRMPYAMTLSSVRASVNTAPTGSTLIVDINEGGSTILSTKLSIDASELTSATAATAAVISDTALADDAEVTIDIDQIGSTVAGKGLKVVLKGVRA